MTWHGKGRICRATAGTETLFIVESFMHRCFVLQGKELAVSMGTEPNQAHGGLPCRACAASWKHNVRLKYSYF